VAAPPPGSAGGIPPAGTATVRRSIGATSVASSTAPARAPVTRARPASFVVVAARPPRGSPGRPRIPPPRAATTAIRALRAGGRPRLGAPGERSPSHPRGILSGHAGCLDDPPRHRTPAGAGPIPARDGRQGRHARRQRHLTATTHPAPSRRGSDNRRGRAMAPQGRLSEARPERNAGGREKVRGPPPGRAPARRPRSAARRPPRSPRGRRVRSGLKRLRPTWRQRG
jgi:hypothetical protein